MRPGWRNRHEDLSQFYSTQTDFDEPSVSENTVRFRFLETHCGFVLQTDGTSFVLPVRWRTLGFC